MSSQGKEATKSEAWEIMSFLMNLIEKSSYGDERLHSLLFAVCEIFQFCEKEHQQHFLQVMVPYLLSMAQVEVDLSMKAVTAEPHYSMENGSLAGAC